jgi:hypothetical protein
MVFNARMRSPMRPRSASPGFLSSDLEGVKMRETLLDTRELAKKLSALERKLTGRLDWHEAAIIHVFQRVMDIIDPPALPSSPPKPRIGFKP